MKKTIYTVIAGIVVIAGYFLEDKIKGTNQSYNNQDMEEVSPVDGFDYLPTSTTNAIVKHHYYSLSYKEEHEQPEWVAHQLKYAHVDGHGFKRPYFELDNKVKTKSAHWKNYKKSGYDRGHLCPAGDRSFDQKAYNETFLTSNISPQIHHFNAGIWNDLEKRIRYWLKKDKEYYIVTGPVFENTNTTIGRDKIPVPTHFYKIVLKYSKGKPKCIAFLIPHNTKNRNYRDFTTTIDALEQKLGIDFFPALDDALENKLESRKNTGFNL